MVDGPKCLIVLKCAEAKVVDLSKPHIATPQVMSQRPKNKQHPGARPGCALLGSVEVESDSGLG